MAALDDLNAQLGRINAATTEIANDLRDAISKLEGGINPSDTTDLINNLRIAADKMEAVAQEYPPTPETPAPPTA